MKRHAASLLLFVLTLPVGAAETGLDAQFIDILRARPLGPANMSGRITAVAVVPDKPAVMYAASASGGLWKTTNRGTTWTPVFEHEATVSLGDVAVARSNPEIVWVGTGEANARNSVSWGDGVYKSTNGGKTWTNMGLMDTHHIGRIVIHPKDPDIVYVAALGHLWGPNKQRGIFKTDDGGKTWDKIKFIDEETGFIDLAMDPTDPSTLYAAAYHVRRGAFAGGNPAVQFGKDSGLYKTTDAGKTWTKLTAGLPEGAIGRCGLSIYRKDPRILYAVVQTEKTDTHNVPGQPAKTSDNAETGGVFRSDDGGDRWVKVNDLCPRPFYFGQIRVDPNDEDRIYVLGVSLSLSTDGGKTFRDAGAGAHSDHHALWINPKDSDQLVLGCDGGLHLSNDCGQTWELFQNLPVAQFYGVAVDMRKPYRVYGGLQDNGSWGGVSATHTSEGITLADWFRVLGADGFQCQVDPADPDTVYAESQWGGLTRVNVRTGDSIAIRPRSGKGEPDYRFNWEAPILVSPHNPRTLYFAGNHVFRSVNRGDQWEVISKDLTIGEPGPSRDNGHTITTLSESPVKPGLLYAGTDDGRLHVTHNYGADWTDLSKNIPDVATERWISRVECSHFDDATAYVSIDRHRNDDRRPYLYKTTDHGVTWVSIGSNLPSDGPVRVIREDLRNRHLLFAGTEFRLFVSLNGGANWHRLNNGLPTVAVHDMVIHPRDRELVMGTHGRGIFAIDIAPLQEAGANATEEAGHLFDVRPALLFQSHGSHSLDGGRTYAAPNPAGGATIYYFLKEKPLSPARLTIVDAVGNAVATLDVEQEAGLHRAVWNLRTSGGEMRSAVPVKAGDYAARLEMGDKVYTKKVRVETEE
jgi:photosystem II stability/assembly factor-like uncharacterized protein